MDHAGLHPQRRGEGTDFRRHLELVDVDADAEHHDVQPVKLCLHFGKDAGNFFTVQERVVRPADVWSEAGHARNRVVDGDARGERQDGRGRWRERRPKQRGRINAHRLLRNPSPPETAPAGRLLLRHDHRPVRRAAVGELERVVVRRAGAEIMHESLADFLVAELRTDEARQEQVGELPKLIAGSRVALDVHAQLPQAFDVIPHGRARHADFARYLRPGNDHGGILREQVNELVDFAVGGSGSHVRYARPRPGRPPAWGGALGA